MATIGVRSFNLIDDKYLALGNEEYVRPLAIGSNWSKIRVGMLVALTPAPREQVSAFFWLPLIGPFLAGFVGGRKAGGVIQAAIAVFLPGLLFPQQK